MSGFLSFSARLLLLMSLVISDRFIDLGDLFLLSEISTSLIIPFGIIMALHLLVSGLLI